MWHDAQNHCRGALLAAPQGYQRLRECFPRLWTCTEEGFLQAVGAVQVHLLTSSLS
jgi:hypothetical protein